MWHKYDRVVRWAHGDDEYRTKSIDTDIEVAGWNKDDAVIFPPSDVRFPNVELLQYGSVVSRGVDKVHAAGSTGEKATSVASVAVGDVAAGEVTNGS